MGTDKKKKFWNRYAKFYDFEIEKTSKAAYEEMVQLISAILDSNMTVLEVATGTGLLALNIAPSVKKMIAIDFSPKMIERAKQKTQPENLELGIEDATALSFSEKTFDAVIISNALHIMPSPQKVLDEISRVLKPNGILIAPNFTHGHLKAGNENWTAKILKFIGFEVHSYWLPKDYVAFIESNGFEVKYWKIIKAAFPLVYLEARTKNNPDE